MEDYEVRDMMRRAVDPALELEFDSPRGGALYQTVEFKNSQDVSAHVPLRASITNKSNQPAMYTVVSIFNDKRVHIANKDDFENAGMARLNPGDVHYHLHQRIGLPGGYPIFREAPLMLGPFFSTIRERMISIPLQLSIGYQIRSPGCFKENHGVVAIDRTGRMHIQMPPK